MGCSKSDRERDRFVLRNDKPIDTTLLDYPKLGQDLRNIDRLAPLTSQPWGEQDLTPPRSDRAKHSDRKISVELQNCSPECFAPTSLFFLNGV
jgi:hypothetical protein